MNVMCIVVQSSDYFSSELTGYFIKIRFAHFIQRYSGVRVVKIIFSPRWEVPSNNL